MRNILFFSGLILSSSVLANSSDPQALTAQVKALWQAKDAQAAHTLLTPLVTKKTKDARLLALLGQTEALATPASDDEAAAAQAQALYQIGRSAVKGGLAVDKGISALQQFIAQQPAADNIDWAKLRLGQLYIAQQQQAKAEEILKPLQASTQDKELKGELQKLL